jgi:hypothetical protein
VRYSAMGLRLTVAPYGGVPPLRDEVLRELEVTETVTEMKRRVTCAPTPTVSHGEYSNTHHSVVPWRFCALRSAFRRIRCLAIFLCPFYRGGKSASDTLMRGGRGGTSEDPPERRS